MSHSVQKTTSSESSDKKNHFGLYIRQCCECMRIIEAHIQEIYNQDDSECVSHGYCPSCYKLFQNNRHNLKILKSIEALEGKHGTKKVELDTIEKNIAEQKKNLIILSPPENIPSPKNPA